MSVDAYVICDVTKTFAYLGKLGAGGFSYGSLNRDSGGKQTGLFIGQHLGNELKIVKCDDIPEGYQEWKEEEKEEDEKPMDLREIGDFSALAKSLEHAVNLTVYEGVGEYTEKDPLFIGSIKWDGCSNWHFPYSYYPLHFCTQGEVREFGELLSKLYDWAAELMPDHKENLGSEKPK
jgi:hypothetical protein